MEFERILEYGLITTIVVVLGSVFITEETKFDITDEPTMVQFYEFPLQAWMDKDKGGEIVKVRYLIDREKTKLYMYDKYGKVVHKQHISLSPHKDGRERIETYHWKLYRTEWTDRIGPGTYQILVGTHYETRGNSIEITIP